MAWATQGRITNPAAGALLAETGPLTAIPSIVPQAVVSASVATQVLMQRRNFDNTANVMEQLLVVNANTTFALTVGGEIRDIADGERIRITVNAAVNGSVQGSLFW